jgi:hypothetical protein
MSKTTGASLACLVVGAWVGAVAIGPAKAAANDVAQTVAPSAAGSTARTRCLYRDRAGHVHCRWRPAPAGGAAVTAPPPPIPSPHYYWRG